MKCKDLRYMRTTQECREYLNAIEQGVYIRPARRPGKQMPTAWDDIFRGRGAGKKLNKHRRIATKHIALIVD